MSPISTTVLNGHTLLLLLLLLLLLSFVSIIIVIIIIIIIIIKMDVRIYRILHGGAKI